MLLNTTYLKSIRILHFLALIHSFIIHILYAIKNYLSDGSQEPSLRYVGEQNSIYFSCPCLHFAGGQRSDRNNGTSNEGSCRFSAYAKVDEDCERW